MFDFKLNPYKKINRDDLNYLFIYKGELKLSCMQFLSFSVSTFAGHSTNIPISTSNSSLSLSDCIHYSFYFIFLQSLLIVQTSKPFYFWLFISFENIPSRFAEFGALHSNIRFKSIIYWAYHI